MFYEKIAALFALSTGCVLLVENFYVFYMLFTYMLALLRNLLEVMFLLVLGLSSVRTCLFDLLVNFLGFSMRTCKS